MEEYNSQGMGEEGTFLEKPIDREEQKRKREALRRAQEAEKWENLKKIPMPGKKAMIAIGVVGAVLVFCIVVYSIAGSFLGPGRTAKNYFKAMLSGDWEKVYQQMEVPEGELLSKENFLATHSEKGNTVKNLKVEKVDENEFTCQYRAVYMLPGDTEERTDTVKLVRQSEKILFLFPKWSVSPEGYWMSDYPIYAPEGYTIKVDGVELTPDETSAGGEGDYQTYGGNIYTVDLFTGPHTLEASGEYMESDITTFHVVSGDNSGYTVERLAFSDEATEEMQGVVKGFMSQLYDEAIHESGPSDEYMSYWVSDTGNLEITKDVQDSAEYLYERFEEQLHDTYYDSIRFTKMQFENYQSQISDSYTMETGAFVVQLYVTYTYNYAYTVTDTPYKGKTNTKNESDSGNDEITVNLMQENGQWKIYSTNMNCVY